MNRDMNLSRLVVLKACTDDANGRIDGHTADEIMYHRQQAIEMGLLKGVVDYDSDTPYPVLSLVVVIGVTAEGHNFIDATRSGTNSN